MTPVMDEKSLGSKSFGHLQNQQIFPLSLSQLAAKFKTVTNAKFLSIADDSAKKGEMER